MAVELAAGYVSLIPSFKGGAAAISKELGPHTSRAGEDLGKETGRRFGSGFSSSLKGVVGGTVAVLAAVKVKDFLGDALGEAREAVAIGKETERVIRTTGGAANVSAAQVGDLAGRLSNLTAQDDELIQSGANLLLTFKNIKNGLGENNQIFDRATGLALDMSTVFKQDLSSSSVQLGKALDDPVKGITALSRVGVSFTAQQKEQIKALTATGDVMGAQKIILAELESQVGGAAAAQATGAGRMSTAWANVKEELGLRLLPVVERASTFFADKLPLALDLVSAALAPIIDGFSRFWTVLTTGFTQDEGGAWFEDLAFTLRDDLLPIIQKLAKWISDHLKVAITGLGIALGLLFSPITVVIAALVLAYTKSEAFRNVVQTVIDKLGDMVAWVRAMMPQFQETFTRITNAVRILWERFGSDILAIIQNRLETMRGVVEAALNVVRGVIQTVVALINGDWGKAWEGIKTIVSGVFAAIKTLISGALTEVRLILSLGLSAVTGIWNGIWNPIETGFSALWGRIKGIVSGAINAIKEMVRSALGPIQGLIDRIGRVRDGKITIDGKTYGGNAQGVRNWKGGLSWVGEEGPELVNLPRGADVYSNPESMALAKAAAMPEWPNRRGITIENMNVDESADVWEQLRRASLLEELASV